MIRLTGKDAGLEVVNIRGWPWAFTANWTVIGSVWYVFGVVEMVFRGIFGLVTWETLLTIGVVTTVTGVVVLVTFEVVPLTRRTLIWLVVCCCWGCPTTSGSSLHLFFLEGWEAEGGPMRKRKEKFFLLKKPLKNDK